MTFLFTYLRQRRIGILVFFLFTFIFIFVFALYHLPAEAVIYPALICILIGSLFLVYDYRKQYRKHKELLRFQTLSAELLDTFPAYDTMAEADYQQLIRLLREEQRQFADRMNARFADMVDYYTVWAHQIKTPIAAMRLNLQNEDNELARKIMEDLQRVEQYVEMVLTFLRLDSTSTDYVFKEYELDDIVRQAVRKFAGQFIRRKIRLVYEPLAVRVVTDEKWLLFVLEQLLSNALKYTAEGSITIALEKPMTLCIRDTGIGVAPEDLPRIFEKGYTGYNGRRDKKASGLGLYLCKRICDNLGFVISAESVPGGGTVIRIDMAQTRTAHE